MDITGNKHEVNENVTEKRRTPPMSYFYRMGQVERLLKTHSDVTIGDLARLCGITSRQMWNITNRMAEEQRIVVRQVPHANTFKHLISRRQS